MMCINRITNYILLCIHDLHHACCSLRNIIIAIDGFVEFSHVYSRTTNGLFGLQTGLKIRQNPDNRVVGIGSPRAVLFAGLRAALARVLKYIILYMIYVIKKFFFFFSI